MKSGVVFITAQQPMCHPSSGRIGASCVGINEYPNPIRTVPRIEQRRRPKVALRRFPGSTLPVKHARHMLLDNSSGQPFTHFQGLARDGTVRSGQACV